MKPDSESIIKKIRILCLGFPLNLTRSPVSEFFHLIIEFVETCRQLANVLTKPLIRLRFMELKKMIGMEGVLGLAAGLREELLSNLLLPCMNARQGQTPKGSLLLHCSRCRGNSSK